MADHEDGDMVAWEACEVGEHAMKTSRPGKAYADLFLKLALKRCLDGLAPFDATTRKEPAWPIAVSYQENAIAVPDDNALRAERQSAP